MEHESSHVDFCFKCFRVSKMKAVALGLPCNVDVHPPYSIGIICAKHGNANVSAQVEFGDLCMSSDAGPFR